MNRCRGIRLARQQTTVPSRTTASCLLTYLRSVGYSAPMKVGEAFEEFVRLVHRLRRPDGCPWDSEQTNSSIKPYLIEEAYEVIEAIERGDDVEFCKELGDLLLQIVFHAEIAAEAGRFTIADVVESISKKLVRRHPHVFGDAEVASAADVVRNWSRIKAEERLSQDDPSVIAGVPRGMPALLRAQRIGEKAGSVGFDWLDPRGVMEKLHEEIDELAAAVDSCNVERAEAELGDLLYAATSLARHLRLNSEDALSAATDRFSKRFRHMEEALRRRKRDLRDATEAEKDELWEEAKHST